MKLKPQEHTILANQILIMKALRNLLGNLSKDGVGSQRTSEDLKVRIELSQQFVDYH